MNGVYHKSEHVYFGMLANAVPCSSDAIVSPPSNRAWLIEPYRNAIAAVHQEAIDLTDAFSRQGVGCGGKGAPLNELLANLCYNPCGREKDFRRVVIVDDAFNTGTTAAAIATLLRDHGVPEECEIIFACPLWLDTVAS